MIPVIRKDLRNGINALHRIRAHGCGEDAPIDNVESLSSPNVKILANHTVLRARAHLICCLHVG
jgi:hypothetical protein